MSANRVLLVDDDEVIRTTLTGVLEQSGFVVTCATNVVEALKRITSEPYDALLSDLHMPGAGDGLTVVSAMRHANPSAVTLLLSAFPHMEAATQAILLQADEILVKPLDVTSLGHVVKERIAIGACSKSRDRERRLNFRSDNRGHYCRVVRARRNEQAVDVRSDDLRTSLRSSASGLPGTGCLRLRSSKTIGSGESLSPSAVLHGLNRHRLGYTAAMLVEESRLLQVCIFHCLQNNLANIDFSVLLIGVMTIADEVDSQLSQAMSSFVAASLPGAPPAWA
jgi:CheY-like chemotaxis protein